MISKQKLQLDRLEVIQQCYAYIMCGKGSSMTKILGLTPKQLDLLYKAIGIADESE